MTLRTAPLIILVGAALLGTLTAAPIAAPSSPATAPDLLPAMDAKVLEPLRQMCRQLNQRRWGPPIVEMFDDPASRNPWQGQNVTIVQKDARLIAAPQGANLTVGVLSRALPKTVRPAEGVRLSIWLEAQPAQLPGQQQMNFFNLGLCLGPGDPRLGQWAFSYYFATGQDGMMQQMQVPNANIHQGMNADKLAADKLTNVRLEIVGRKITGRRGQTAPLSITSDLSPVLAAGGDAQVALMGLFKQVRLAKVTYWGLEPVFRESDLAGQWKRTSFANQEALTAHLLERVVPHLDARRFQNRHAAQSLLETLWPLSRPAVETAARSPAGLSPEGQFRLQTLLEFVPEIELLAPASQPDDDKPPPGFKPVSPTTKPDKPAATQPDKPARLPKPLDLLRFQVLPHNADN